MYNKRILLKFLDKFFYFLIKIHSCSNKIKKSEIIIKKILVIKLSAMGDAICLMPSIRELKKIFPHSEINWLTTIRTNPFLFSNIQYINRTILLPLNIFHTLFFILKNYYIFRKYDLIINFDQFYKLSEFICIQGMKSTGFSNGHNGKKYTIAITYDPFINERINFIRLVNCWSSKKSFNKIDYSMPEILTGYLPPTNIRTAFDNLSKNKRILFIYSGSSNNAIFRRWTFDNFINVALFFQHKMNVVFIGGPDELCFKPLINNNKLDAFDFIGYFKLIDLAFIFNKYSNSIFLGNDGGLLHLAESQRVPIVGIFGPALYRKWGSLNPLSVGLELELSCRPCLRGELGIIPSSCHRGDIACMNISVDNVISAILKIDNQLNISQK